MKKIIVGIIILLAFGIAALIIGFIHIPQDHYAVIHTTLLGFDEKIYNPDTRLWRWEKLLPTVMTVYKFQLSPYKAELESPLKGDLFASAADYARALGEDISFSFELEFMLEISIIPDNLVQLVKDGLRPDNISQFYEKSALKISERLSNMVLKEPEFFFQEDYINKFKKNISSEKDFFGIEINTIIPTKPVKVPDYDLYLVLKERYLSLLEEKVKSEIEKMNIEKMLKQKAIQKEMDIIQHIENYGEILTKYPIIMEFLNSKKGTENK